MTTSMLWITEMSLEGIPIHDDEIGQLSRF